MTTIKTASGQALSVGAGNAFAYFVLEALRVFYEYVPDDPAVWVAMGGTLLGVFALHLAAIGRGIKSTAKYVFDRFFPPKEA